MFVVALLALLHSHAQTQPNSRRLQLDEAEQLALEAQSLGYKSERMRYRSETAATEVHAEAIKAMSRAISIWEQLEVPSLVGAGLTELSRLQVSFGDVDAALASTRRKIDYWHAHGDLQREGEACSELSARLWAGRRNAEALAMLEQTIAFAQANHLSDLYANELSMKAIYLKAMGRNPEADVAEQMAAKANLERLGSMHQAVAEPEARMPDRWLDVQAAPCSRSCGWSMGGCASSW